MLLMARVCFSQFAGAGSLMLLCDGENCEEACHSFCLKIPLQSIPEGDWLCPLCVHEKHAKEAGEEPMKRTSKLRAKIMPSLKKIEAIIGSRKDPSVAESDQKKSKHMQYLVKWSSLSHRHVTWVCSRSHNDKFRHLWCQFENNVQRFRWSGFDEYRISSTA
jgi:chromodomain-helicase-DNA-binding protein 4